MSKYAGRLRLFVNKWESFCDDDWILKVVNGYKIEVVDVPFQACEPKSLEKEANVDNCIERLLSIGAIEQVQDVAGQFVSPIFTVPKSDGSHRLILNLKKFNQFIIEEHFKLEDIRTVSNLLRKNMFMATIDMKDAYHLISIHPESRKFLRFRYSGKLYQYNVLPFGLSVAPLVFTKVMRPIMAKLRGEGHLSVIYLDDIWVAGADFDSCQANVKATVEFLTELGFIINTERSVQTPQTSVRYLGFIFDSALMSISLPTDKREKLINMCHHTLSMKCFSVQYLAEFLGHLVSACPAVPFGLLYTRQLETLKIAKLQSTGDDWNAKLMLTDEARHDIQWWLENIPKAFAPIRDDSFDLEIFTDASQSGYGIIFGKTTTRGFWSSSEKVLHINHRELMAALYALKCFTDVVQDRKILFRIDNMTAVAFINRFGGTRSDTMLGIAKEIFQICQERNVWIRASYIKGSLNVRADLESRRELDDTDWQLNPQEFRKICKLLEFSPEVDLFATRLTAQCDRFVSWFPDPSCEEVDAFTIPWSNKKFYAFPPFCLVARVIRKILNEKAEGIVVFPFWKTQAWYPLIKSNSITTIHVFGPSSDLLIFPCDSRSHPLAPKLQLAAAIISGKPSSSKGCHRILYH